MSSNRCAECGGSGQIRADGVGAECSNCGGSGVAPTKELSLDDKLEIILNAIDGGDVRISYPDGTSEIKDAEDLFIEDIKALISSEIMAVIDSRATSHAAIYNKRMGFDKTSWVMGFYAGQIALAAHQRAVAEGRLK
jgi:hypothetical protein